MKKLISIIALAAITMGSVYAAPMQQQDTTKVKKNKVKKDTTGNVKIKGDTTEIKTKKDSVK